MKTVSAIALFVLAFYTLVGCNTEQSYEGMTVAQSKEYDALESDLSTDLCQAIAWTTYSPPPSAAHGKEKESLTKLRMFRSALKGQTYWVDNSSKETSFTLRYVITALVAAGATPAKDKAHANLILVQQKLGTLICDPNGNTLEEADVDFEGSYATSGIDTNTTMHHTYDNIAELVFSGRITGRLSASR